MREIDLTLSSGGNCQAVSISSTSAQSGALPNDTAVIYATVACFARTGSNPTALATGVDIFIPATTMLRITVPNPGDKIAFVTSSATGTVYIAPGA